MVRVVDFLALEKCENDGLFESVQDEQGWLNDDEAVQQFGLLPAAFLYRNRVILLA